MLCRKKNRFQLVPQEVQKHVNHYEKQTEDRIKNKKRKEPFKQYVQPTCSGDKIVSCNSTSFQFSTKPLTEPGRGLETSPDIRGSSSE